MSTQLALFPEAVTVINCGSYWEALAGPRWLCWVYRHPDGYGVSTVPHHERRFASLEAAAEYAAGLRAKVAA